MRRSFRFAGFTLVELPAVSRRERRAFTLVELLVVIGIIAVLIGILIPALARARLAAQATECQSNMRQIGIGLRMYAEANHGWLPSAGEDGDKSNDQILLPDKQGWASEMLWINAANRAMSGKTYNQIQLDAMNGSGHIPKSGDHHVLVCPSSPEAAPPPNPTDGDIVQNGYFEMVGAVNDNNGNITSQQRDTFICYAFNYKLFGSTTAIGKITQIDRPSETCVVFEKRTSVSECTQADDDYYNSVGGGANKILNTPIGRLRGDWRRVASRHSKGAFILYADGHAGRVLFRDALTPNTLGVKDWNHPGLIIWNIKGPAS
jgi:prepilin-type N-terminal cleavage/methylation domain-containing protein/prepilin-type processing-associated H-X9-DG protein